MRNGHIINESSMKKHRWVVVVAFRISDDMARLGMTGMQHIILSSENLLSISELTCIDCKQKYKDVVKLPCLAEPFEKCKED